MFPLLRSLRAKSVLAGLVPFALVLAVVAVIAVNAYDRVARNGVTQRDAELARVSAARLSERLEQHTLALQRLAADGAVRSLEAARVERVLERAAPEFFVFDGGLIVYDAHGVAIASRPPFRASQPQWSRFADPSPAGGAPRDTPPRVLQRPDRPHERPRRPAHHRPGARRRW